jgi:hypothetical protein
VVLQAGKVDEFLRWVVTAPAAQRDTVRKQIAAAAGDDRVVDDLTDRLMHFPVADHGRHLMILSTIGEMRRSRAINPLKQFIWYDKDMFTATGSASGTGIQTSYFYPTRALQSRAVEMLAYIGGEEALAATREVAAKHPGREVRIAAMNAYLFNQGDSEAAKAELTQIVPENDRKYIGLARRTHDMNLQAFEAQVRAYYEKYPKEIPPTPAQVKQTERQGERVRPQERGSQ